MSKLQAYKLMHSGALALQKAEYTGIHVSVQYCKQMGGELSTTIDSLEKEILESDIGKLWTEMAGEDFKIDSTTQLGKVLYGLMNIKPAKYTPGEKGSVDEEALEELNIPVLNKLLEMRKLKKLRDTYMDQFLEEQTDGILHPYFNLHTVKTYRSSSSHPNFQNIPKRDDKANEICRRAFIPSPGFQFLELDYSGIEVRIAASIVGDPRLRQDVLEGDMHKDLAMELYCLEEFDYTDKGDKQLRYGAKNGFTFAQFYGSYYKQCAPILLKNAENVDLKMGCTAWENLHNLGYIKLDDNGKIIEDNNYYHHVQEVEKDFWGKRYKVYNVWKKQQWKRYLQTGRVDFPTGFEIYGKMRKNEVLNAPIQGSAFHVLLLAFIMINNIRLKEGWKTKMIGQIHDAIVFDVHPDELEMVYKTAADVMENKVREIWKWINVPLKVEAELFGIDEPWFEGKPYGGDK